jgi:cytochrome P450
LHRKYREIGPIFRIKLIRRRFTVMAGLEANQFFIRESNALFRAAGFWEGFGRAVNAREFLVSIDGPPHRRLRSVMKPGFSKEAVLHRLPEFISLTREIADRYEGGRRIPVVRLTQRLASQQLGALLCNVRADEYFDDLRVFIKTILNATVIGRWPRMMLYLPPYRRARRRAYQFARELVAHHKSTSRAQPDIVDDLLAAYEAGDIYETDDELYIAVIGPFLAGMDTVANTIAFMLYALLHDPSAMERVRQDAATLIGGEGPTVAKLKCCRALLGAIWETLRLYPIVPAVLRSAAEPFCFAGCRVDAGEVVMIATTVPHYLPEIYANPAAFDIDRFQGEQVEPRSAGAFAPFGLGAHSCLGSNLAEVMMALTVATLVHDYRIEMAPSDYALKISANPTPSPTNFRVRLFRD